MGTTARLVGVGTFVLAGLLLFAIALFMIGDRQMAFARKFILYTEFAKITGVAPGTIVRVSGAKAGSVKEIQVPSGPSKKFRIKMEVTQDLHPLIRIDSIASIQTEGLVGGTYLAIGTGSDQAARALENSTIPSREPFEIGDLVQQMSDTVKKVNDTIDLLQGDLQHAVQSIGETVDNANVLINDVSDDVKKMASAGARIAGDAAEIADNIRAGKGTIGKLLTDDELYRRATAVAKRAEEIATSAKQVVEDARKAVEDARKALETLQAKNGPVQGLASNFKQTIDDARGAMAGFSENMEALKRNFLFRGFFNRRGYFDLTQVSPAEYRKGKLTANGARHVVRVWLSSPVVLNRDPVTNKEGLTDDGKLRLDSALAPFLDQVANAVLMVEGYSQLPTTDQQYLQARERAVMVREYLIGRFHLDPGAVGFIPLGHESPGSPGNVPWDGVALAVYMEKS